MCSRRPRVLLVSDLDSLPADDDELEDWVCLPSDEGELASRLEMLQTRASQAAAEQPRTADVPSCVVSPLQRRLGAVLFCSIGRLVTSDELRERCWDVPPSSAALARAVARLRRSLQGSEWSIASVPGRGFVLHEVHCGG